MSEPPHRLYAHAHAHTSWNLPLIPSLPPLPFLPFSLSPSVPPSLRPSLGGNLPAAARPPASR
eukprot:718795-Rhodomonas_salina.1